MEHNAYSFKAKRIRQSLETARACLIDLRNRERVIEGRTGPAAIAHYIVINAYATKLVMDCPADVAAHSLNDEEAAALNARLQPWAMKTKSRIDREIRRRQGDGEQPNAAGLGHELELWVARSAGLPQVLNMIAQRTGRWVDRMAPYIDWLGVEELWALKERRKRLHEDGAAADEVCKILSASPEELNGWVDGGLIPVLGTRQLADDAEVPELAFDRLFVLNVTTDTVNAWRQQGSADGGLPIA